MAQNSNESSRDESDKNYEQWANKISGMNDEDASKFILQHIVDTSDLSSDDKVLLQDAYEYCMKLIRQRKPLDIDLLKIYLGQIKNYKVNDVNLYNLVILLGCCGIYFEK